jgi:hypothetical protein
MANRAIQISQVGFMGIAPFAGEFLVKQFGEGFPAFMAGQTLFGFRRIVPAWLGDAVAILAGHSILIMQPAQIR